MARDPYKYFRVEARELLEQLGKGILELEKGAATADVVARLLRVAHTLKGAARVVKQPEIADEAHGVEDALAPYRDSVASVPRAEIDALLARADAMAARVAMLDAPVDAVPTVAVQSSPDEALRGARPDVGELDALLAGLAETHAGVSSLRRSLVSVERGRVLTERLVDQLSPRHAGGHGVARATAEELRAVFGVFERSVATSLEQLDRELTQVRDAAEQMRLVSAGTLFASLERTARDTARALGIEVALEGHGHDVRLDAHVLGAVHGALTQLVRNAVAHGIEPPDARRAAGKPVLGRVTISVVRRGRRVAFGCRDDGRGVDAVAVRRAAELRGVVAAGAPELAAADLLALLLRGGISTSGSVTAVSGRGVGLDVVREALERLGGEATLDTRAGQGTTIELVVPLSLASFEGLGVAVAGVAAVIPLDAVRGTLRVAPGDVSRTASGETIVRDGEVVPFFALDRALVGAVAVESRRERTRSAVIVQGSRGLAAVGVDRLVGTARIVLHPLPVLAPADELVSGACLDAAGDPQLVLDPDGLVAEARRPSTTSVEAAPRTRTVLVIDDSLTTRMLEQSILESAGYEVDVAISGEEALELAHRKRYALFLVDVEMPGIDGFTFIERARDDAALRDVPAILVTSRSSDADKERGRAVGARGFVVKSAFDQAELLERIRKLVD